MEILSQWLTTQPLFALFITIALGYALGAVSIKGLSLGSGAVLFVGLAMGAIAPNAALPNSVGGLGLLLFLYGVGIAYGAQFFKGLSSSLGLKANAASLIGVLLTLAVMLAAIKWIPNVQFAEALGAFAGAGTSTSALQAAMAVTGDKLPATGYSVAYPFGVAIPIFIIGLYNSVFKPKFAKPERVSLRVCAVRLDNPEMVGHRLHYINTMLPDGVTATAATRDNEAHSAEYHGALQVGDVILLSAVDNDLLEQTAPLIGSKVGDTFHRRHGDLDYLRLFVSNSALQGKTIAEVRNMLSFDVSILHVRRVDTDMVISPNLRLEMGDQVGVFATFDHVDDLRAVFGDSVRATGELSFLSMGIGAALGLAIGSIPLHLPVLGKFSLGFAGLLMVALYLGKLRRSAYFVWSMPVPANQVLRNFGLTLFLAQVGMASGQTFVDTVSQSGLTYLFLGIVLVALLSSSVLLICMYVFRLPFDMAAGIVSGATGNPAILAFSSRTLASDKPDIGYAMIFPSMTIVKILVVQIVGAIGLS